MFESGSYNIRPEELKDVIAISSRNSIFVSRLLLDDPASLEHINDISRVVGNVGKTGMILMVAPQAPRLRKAGLDDFRLVTHAPFDWKLEDSFKATSLHLRFTEFEMAFNIGERGAIDKDLSLVETLVQVYERDRWVADIDVLPLFNPSNDLIRRNQVSCAGCSNHHNLPHRLLSVDNWEELLDVPEGLGKSNIGVVRAYDNWLARLAAACVSVQKGYRTVINPTKAVCWHCACRKKWGWRQDTILRSSKAVCCEEEYDPCINKDDDDGSDHDSDESEDSDSAGSLGSPELEEGAEPLTVEGLAEMAATNSLSGAPPMKLTAQDELRSIDDADGYESDETVLSLEPDDEDEEKRRHLPQVFIM
ncbi:hypothetical protein BU26DRAFT_520702 [Trematosphaeria pertusa]|uniref:Uncharacterized protein n=1 Tax=Trematosphaeria pertusa TaxID=390896 RepID=A0A6A6IC07_9PLEO|nr:uncharacterized protein BU26DRAFT_520702 [Trematosphaeria pertusa]KAF2247598.1 hypothetical protein BU26DRAFT_520702 [Trematosphaeria pertusa]